MLIVEDEEGHYQPLAIASTLAEAFEMAKEDLQGRQRLLEIGGDPGLCPYEYKLWARGLGGVQTVAAT
jgi:hypothetical protein